MGWKVTVSSLFFTYPPKKNTASKSNYEPTIIKPTRPKIPRTFLALKKDLPLRALEKWVQKVQVDCYTLHTWVKDVSTGGFLVGGWATPLTKHISQIRSFPQIGMNIPPPRFFLPNTNWTINCNTNIHFPIPWFCVYLFVHVLLLSVNCVNTWGR